MPSVSSVLAHCPWIPSFRSDDLDEVRHFFGEFGGRARVAHAHQPLGCLSQVVRGRRLEVGSTTTAVGQTARWVAGAPVLQLSVPEGTAYRTGRHETGPVGADSIVVLPAGWEWTRSSPAGSVLALVIAPDALCTELRALDPSGEAGLPRRVLTRQVDPAHRARLMAAVKDMALAARPEAEAGRLALAEARLLGIAVGLVLDDSEAQASPAMSERRIRDLENWIEANLAAPITLGSLCRIAGVGARSLQRAFEQRRGMSPMRFVAERRALATYNALVDARVEDSVTRIALSNGFDHLGRFARLYRQVVGEPPSATLARRQRR